MRLVLILFVFWPLHTSIKNIDSQSHAQNSIEGFYQVDKSIDLPASANTSKRAPANYILVCGTRDAKNNYCIKE